MLPEIRRLPPSELSPSLLEPDPPPRELYVRGSLPGASRPAVAVVGSRAASPAGVWCAHRLGHDLAAAGVVVVSGLARGVDAAAHQGALDAGGTTLAFLGSGLDRLSPLARELGPAIAAEGALVSEYPPDFEARPYRFVERNRLIAAGTAGTVVVEGGARSGALITAGLAAALGRQVWAVPGDPRRPGCRGSNRLLRDGVPAVLDAADVLAALGLRGARREGDPAPPPGLDEASEAVWRVLHGEGTVDAEGISRITRLPATRVFQALSRLELAGHARREPGGFALDRG